MYSGMTREEIVSAIREFCAARGMATTTFGRLSVNDGKLVGRLEAGGSITLDTAEKVRQFIARNETAEAE